MTNRSCEGRSAAQSQTSFSNIKAAFFFLFFLLRRCREKQSSGERAEASEDLGDTRSTNWNQTERHCGENRTENEETWETRLCSESHAKQENLYTQTRNSIPIIQFVYMCIMSTHFRFSASPRCAYASFICNFPRFSVALAQALWRQWQAEVN